MIEQGEKAIATKKNEGDQMMKEVVVKTNLRGLSEGEAVAKKQELK